MRSALSRLCILWLSVAAMISPAMLVAAPACVQEGGIGGTGAPMHNGGIGGTGAPARDGGLGGTGAPASGIGGTGAPARDGGLGGSGAPASGIGGTGAPLSDRGDSGSEFAGSGVGGTGAPLAGSGVGGTGAPARQGGMGGTGAPLASGGIGGTGSPAGGLGGTGIVGTITGFASVCVNGVEVHFQADTPVDVNAAPATIANLAVGQVVAIRAGASPRGLEARSISVINAYEGPVTDVGRGNELRVLGQPVRIIAGQRPANLRTGDKVRVSGLRAPNGELQATYIAAAPDLRDVSVAGPIDGPSSIAGVRVSGAMGPRGAALVRGSWTGRALRPELVKADPVSSSLHQVDRALIEGFVLAQARERLNIGGIQLQLPAGTQFRGGAPSELRVGARVLVSAKRGAEDRLQADSISFVRERASQRGDDGHRRRSDDKSGSDGSGTNSGQSGTRAESRVDSDDDGESTRSESRIESDDGSLTESRIETDASEERSEIKSSSENNGSETRMEVRTESSDRERERLEVETRGTEGERESRERFRSERDGDRVERRERIETYDESGRRIERIETRDRDGQRETRRDTHGPSREFRDHERIDRIERLDRIEEPERVERIERIEEPERVERVEKIEEPERIERIEKIEEPERVERIERIDEPVEIERIERVERIEEPEEVERIERIERIEEPEEIERPEKIDNSGKG